jgi:hypothetical protein
MNGSMSGPAPFDPYLEWLGIEPHEQPADHYRLLGVPRYESSADAIRAAADGRMAHVRSFQTGPRGIYTQSLLNELTAAKLCLLDPQAKARYDARLSQRLAAAASGPSMPPPAPISSLQPPPHVEPPPPISPAISSPPVDSFAPPMAAQASSTGSTLSQPAAEGEPVESESRRLAWWLVLIPVLLIAVLVVATGVWGVGRWRLARMQQQSENGGEAVDGGDGNASDGADGEDGADAGETDVGPSNVVQQQRDGTLRFRAADAQIHGTALRLEEGPTASSIVNWILRDDWLSWDFRVEKPAVFHVRIVYRAAEDAAGGEYELAIGDERKTATVRTSPADGECTDELYLAVRRTGRHTLSMRVITKPGSELLTLKEIRLSPAAGFR